MSIVTPPASSPSLSGERVAFTGTLASMTHKEAFGVVAQNGGTATEHVSRQTTLLVVGEEGWPLETDGSPAVKFQQALHWQEQGLPLRMLRESEWLASVGLFDQERDIHRCYTPAMLSQMLGIPVNVIRGWERAGLIRPATRISRLPYFDFLEVTSVRKLSELLAQGVSQKEISSSLARLDSVLGGDGRALAQLHLLAADKHLVLRDAQGHLQTADGQLLLDFDPAESVAELSRDVLTHPDSAASTVETERRIDDWFLEGCRLADAGDLPAAIEAWRLVLMEDAERPVVQFHLADALYRLGRLDAAIERYHMAVESDHHYLEAWIQLGCLYAEQNDLEAAANSFRIALDIHADCPDAHYHLAETLHLAGKGDEAIPHWNRYLEFDQRGPWAAAARERLSPSGGDSDIHD